VDMKKTRSKRLKRPTPSRVSGRLEITPSPHGRRRPEMIPELNPDHADIIPFQRKRLGTKRGFIAV
jgi:aspartate-semialdehyde dehydrogenase